MFTQARLDAAVRRGMAQMAAAPPRRADSKIEVMYQIPQVLRQNAELCHGVDPNDHEYWADMARLNPWIKPAVEGKIRVDFRSAAGHVARPRNRFGMVSERIYYTEDGRRRTDPSASLRAGRTDKTDKTDRTDRTGGVGHE